MSIKTFLENWEKNTTELPNGGFRLYKDVLEVQLSESGRANTVRINAMKSLERKKGHSTKFMKWLTKEADKGEFILSACVQPWGHSFEKTPKLDDLRGWFAKYGFRLKWEYPDGQGAEMHRQPREKK